MRELVEFLDHGKFADDLLSTNGTNTAGVKLCDVAERAVDDPWDKATVLLGDTGTGTTLSAFVVDTKRDFMLEPTFSDLDMEYHGEKLTWTWDKAAKHFREVTVVNACQAMADRHDKTH
ncbi:hypothetical protein [Saccharothrix luteola]|uniref:hypothetical protein n=1 Tax=Saccharothrix luteola TaxID=2893018 RepID=UPI001E59B9AB|nr:hypothetical protein [Saccharothrix luteola]MCC8249241.1 hypothetical protein [Saccharothrix luteola]